MTAVPTYYVQVLLPLKLGWIPTYRSSVPLDAGQRVCVALGSRRYDGVVWRRLERPDMPEDRIQPVIAVQEDLPRVTAEEMRFWEFLSDYYLCTPGEVYKAAWPLLKIRSERTAAQVLARKRAREEKQRQAVAGAIARLQRRIEKKEQALAGRHGERVTARLGAEIEALRTQIRALEETAPPSDRSGPMQSRNLRGTATQKNAATQWDTRGNALPRIGLPADRQAPGRPTVLLEADRTDFYREQLQAVLSAGRQALILCPEIAFCDRLESRLQDFGERLYVFHSGKTPAKRRRAAEVLRAGEAALVLGTRSALFLPFRDLGLVIIDEEQDPAYKQGEPAPRYHGRDAAVALAEIHGARVLLGASVPSLETLLNVRLGKYAAQYGACPVPGLPSGGVSPEGTPPLHAGGPAPDGRSPENTARHAAETAVPHAEVIDIAAERRKNGMVGPFSRKLLAAVAQTEGPVALIRGWENPEVLQAEAGRLFAGREFRILTLNALKRDGAAGAVLIAVLQADALIGRDDFRGDERAVQLVGMLGGFAQRVLIQTAVPARFNGTRTLDELLDERKRFGFPPYTRLVEVRRQGGGEVVARHFLARDRQLAERKAAIAASLPAACYPDVDPTD